MDFVTAKYFLMYSWFWLRQAFPGYLPMRKALDKIPANEITLNPKLTLNPGW